MQAKEKQMNALGLPNNLEEERNRPHLYGRALTFCYLLIAFLLLSASSASAAVEEKLDVTHLYSAAESLTGTCLTLSVDTVKDPPCDDVPPGPMPPKPLKKLLDVAVDAHGFRYVVNWTSYPSSEGDKNIFIFSPDGYYTGEITIPESFGFPQEVAVDSTGHLYLTGESKLVRYDPTVYSPATGKIEYGSSPVTITTEQARTIAVESSNDHLFVNRFKKGVREYEAPTDGIPNTLLTESIGEGTLNLGENAGPMAVDPVRGKIYVGDWVQPGDASTKEALVRVFDANAPYELLATFDGSTTPAGDFGDVPQYIELAVDEETGNFFVLSQNRIYEMEPDGTYVGTIRKPAFDSNTTSFAYDNGSFSPKRGFVYVATGETQGRLAAYEPISDINPPLVEATSVEVKGEEEAVLLAKINPAGQPTHYRFEITTQADFEANGFANAQLVGEGDLPKSGDSLSVSAIAEGLEPGTAYRFRVTAENECEPGGCAAEAEDGFATFPRFAEVGSVCPNQALRSGASARLPDCRAYELVSPPSTGGRAPFAPGENGPLFATPTASAAGDSVVFIGNGGAYPGYDQSGGYAGDPYVSRRGADGWSTAGAGLNGRQAGAQLPGGFSPDHVALVTEAQGTLNLEVELTGKGLENTTYIRYPDGSLELAGEGSVGTDRQPRIRYLSAGGDHLLFSSQIQLEPTAPASKIEGIYDRAPDGTLRVVSLLPDESTPTDNAIYQGSSIDGSSVAFNVGLGAPLYLRLDNAETVEAAPSGSKFAGLSEEGRYLFYLLGGDLYRFDSVEGTTERLSEAGDVVPAYVPAEGTSAFFISEDVLVGEPNPQGDEAKAGAPNLYRWSEGELTLVATVTEEDVKGEFWGTAVGKLVRGFSEWMSGIDTSGRFPVRATGDGQVLLFESRADLTDFESAGHKQIYRFDARENTLECVSCAPTLATPSTDSVLLSDRQLLNLGLNIPGVPAAPFSIVPNLSSDGRRAFFESEESLVPADEDGLRDVYEWEAQGKGSCAEPGGCLYLISSGKSARADYLYGASASGDDVFVYTADLLTAEDVEATPSIYDARVGGGFAPPTPPSGECLGEACQPAAMAPQDPTPGSSTYAGKGNVADEAKPKSRRCPKGKRKVRRGGKVRCVPKSHKKQTKKADTKRRAHR